MPFQFSQRSLKNLTGVHDDLVRVTKRALEYSAVDFAVIEGLRTVERQKVLVSAGASQTMKSRHLTGHAVDLAAFVDGVLRWDWPLYDKIANAMFKAAVEYDVPIIWGGHWTSFKDGPHFELDRQVYP